MAKSNKKDNIEMKTDFPNDELLEDSDEGNILAKDEDFGLLIWTQNDNQGKIIIIMIDNVTVKVSEPQFYSLTKLTQIATKKLLNI